MTLPRRSIICHLLRATLHSPYPASSRPRRRSGSRTSTRRDPDTDPPIHALAHLDFAPGDEARMRSIGTGGAAHFSPAEKRRGRWFAASPPPSSNTWNEGTPRCRKCQIVPRVGGYFKGAAAISFAAAVSSNLRSRGRIAPTAAPRRSGVIDRTVWFALSVVIVLFLAAVAIIMLAKCSAQ